MRISLNALRRDPILHFAVLGSLLFAVDAFSNRSPDKAHIITVDQERMEWLAKTNQAETGHRPSREVLNHLIDAWVRDEMLYREATRLGMQEDDVIVRRRLVEKLRFLMDSVAHVGPPTDQELRDFYRANSEQFAEPGRYGFSHIFFSADGREDAFADASDLLAELERPAQQTHRQKAVKFGDPFMLDYHFSGRTLDDISATFGDEFAVALPGLAAGSWSGPVRSAYGWHLVKIIEKTASHIPAYEEVESAVQAFWLKREREKGSHQAFAELRQRYRIEIKGETDS